MLRGAASKVMWVRRTTVFLVGLALIRDVGQCVFVATLADSVTGEISGRHDGEDLAILTWDSAGNVAHRPFNLIVVC
jgi:hypothetical protein